MTSFFSFRSGYVGLYSIFIVYTGCYHIVTNYNHRKGNTVFFTLTCSGACVDIVRHFFFYCYLKGKKTTTRFRFYNISCVVGFVPCGHISFCIKSAFSKLGCTTFSRIPSFLWLFTILCNVQRYFFHANFKCPY